MPHLALKPYGIDGSPLSVENVFPGHVLLAPPRSVIGRRNPLAYGLVVGDFSYHTQDYKVVAVSDDGDHSQTAAGDWAHDGKFRVFGTATNGNGVPYHMDVPSEEEIKGMAAYLVNYQPPSESGRSESLVGLLAQKLPPGIQRFLHV